MQAGGETWLLSGKSVESLGIAPGSRIDPHILKKKAAADQEPWAKTDTERFLSRSEHTALQLSSYLQRKKYIPSVVRSTVEWAENCGLISDRRYADIYVRSHSARSPMGNFRIGMELRKRGVSQKIVDEILAGRDERQLHDSLVEEIRSRYGGLDHGRALRRASGYLQRRGFEYSVIRSILEKAFHGGEEEPD